ncbi:hypothetical protein OAL13_00195 [bacterium]|nr:hypothetical protein [bacterium]
MQSTQQFIDGVLAYYQEADIQLGDLGEGLVDRAHHPQPRHLGGTETVRLLRQHHAIHNVLQSVETGTCCCFGAWEREAITNGHFVTGWFDLLDALDRVRSQGAREAALALHSRKTKAGKSAHAIKAALTRHHG